MATEPPHGNSVPATRDTAEAGTSSTMPDAAEVAHLKHLRTKLAHAAISRAELRAREAFQASPYHDDDAIAAQVEKAIAKSRPLAMRSIANPLELLVGAVSQLETQTQQLAWKRCRILAGWTAVVIAITGLTLLDIWTGPGPIPDDLSGWQEWLLTSMGYIVLVAIGLGVWAVSDWFATSPQNFFESEVTPPMRLSKS